MTDYRRSAHSVHDIKYHLVWITKYRKAVLTGQIARRTRELTRSIRKVNDVEILAGHVSKDHIHLLVSAPPHLSASKLAQCIKGATSRKLLMEHKELSRQFGGETSVGKRVFCGERRECHRRDHRRVHSKSGYRSGKGR